MVTYAEFQISYDGNALKTNAMDVRDLAPALLAFGKLFDESNRVINGNKTSVRLQVKATKPGSFSIVFQLDQTLATQITGFLTGDPVTSAINLLTILGFIGVGIKTTHYSFLWLVRRLKGKRPTKISDLKNGTMQIEFESETFVVPVELLRLYQDVAVRKATEEILEPLKSEGIEKFIIYNEQNIIIEQIFKTEVPYYELPEIEDEVILEIEHQAAYSIISLAFKEDNKWRLYDGSSTISVTMADPDFLYKVDNNLVSFAKGDILLCTVKTTQYRINTGLRTEYTVLKVGDHKPAARQLLLFDEPKTDK